MPPAKRPRRLGMVLPIVLGAAILATSRLGTRPPDVLPLPSVEPGATVLLAVGDIGSCDAGYDERVATVAATLPGTIALLGDIAYPDGSSANFAECFDPAWGPMIDRLRPAPGNHEYETAGAAAYFSYFGAVAGTLGASWYSYELGAWHVVSLDSNCEIVGCGPASPQMAWLEGDLATHPAECTLAYWHHPRWSSARHGDHDFMDPIWDVLAAAGADLVLAGHDHDYERFGPIDGMRSFVVGTGGKSLYQEYRPRHAVSEQHASDSFGLLMLTLHDAGYDWRFVPAAGSSLTDAGSGDCH